MATATARYFSGTQEVKNPFPMRNEEFTRLFPGETAKRYDGYSRFVAHPIEGKDALLPVTRIIFFKKNPSLHKCDARCRHAKGHNCECSCGGKYHGAGG